MENMRFLYWDDYEEDQTPKKPNNDTFSDSLEDDE